MARISTYPLDTKVVGGDKWIGSDSQNNFQTKNFTAEAVAEFIFGAGSQGQLFKYKYSMEAVAQGELGDLLFPAGGAASVPLNTINTFTLSDNALNQGGVLINVSTWYTSPLIGSEILFTQVDNITQWAIFSWNSAQVNATNTKFSDIGLTYRGGNGSLTEGKEYFISLLTYGASSGGDKNFVSAQLNGNNVYTVTHNLDKFPAVSVSLGTQANPTEEVECEVTYLNKDQVSLEFTNNFTGVAIFN